MEQKRIKVRLTENSPYSDYGYYKKGDIGYIDGYVNDSAVIILENGKFAKADLRWIEVVNEEDKNVNTVLKESEDERIIERIKKAVESYWSDEPLDEILSWLEKQGEQNHAWSEEDEQTFIKSVEALEDSYNFMLADWLKEHKNQFLRPQNRWKPSDEQMQALSNAGNSFRPFEEGHKILWSLYNDLKKLREE